MFLYIKFKERSIVHVITHKVIGPIVWSIAYFVYALRKYREYAFIQTRIVYI